MILSYPFLSFRVIFQLPPFPTVSPSHSTTSTIPLFPKWFLFSSEFSEEIYIPYKFAAGPCGICFNPPKMDGPPWLPPKQICYSAADSAESPRYSHHSCRFPPQKKGWEKAWVERVTSDYTPASLNIFPERMMEKWMASKK